MSLGEDIKRITSDVSNIGKDVVKLDGKIENLDTKIGQLATSIELTNCIVEVKDFARKKLEEHVTQKHDKKNSSAPGGASGNIMISLPFKLASGGFVAGAAGMIIYYLIRYFFGV